MDQYAVVSDTDVHPGGLNPHVCGALFLMYDHPKFPCQLDAVMTLNILSFHDCTNTLSETNIAPENRPSQKETSIPTIHFQVPR